ncbi:MAG: proline--tRNA ligase [Elusimicrobia bacterium RIFCSPLOWO2_01_FULL_59_12]|nr:MAG: proline--tRNA ligase [Elusimicrobia bacterium RIFCSPLOWO2_01_FULL_59_12]
MRFSQSFIPTLRELPAEAETVAHQLMLRAGLLRKLASGIYEWLPAGLRVLRKVEHIVREEMNAVGGQEVWLPQLQPRELWEETGRWGVYGKELMRLKDRKNADFCLAPTAEEVITDLVRRDVRSYRNLPLMLYQFGVKYRDEIRPRFGVMRAREFYMKDAYSFHTDEADVQRYYQDVFEAYKKIFTRCGLTFRPVEADPGAIGGNLSHEFMVLADTGEEGIVSCTCGYAANVERAELKEAKAARANNSPSPEEVLTPGAKSVEDVAQVVKRPADHFIKALLLKADDHPIMVLVRGDHELNEVKLRRYLKAGWVAKADEETYEKASGSPVGFAGPVKSRARILADYAVEGISDAVVGGNKKDTHLVHVVPGRDFKPEAYADLRKAVAGDPCPKCGKPMEGSRGIEVGHTFQLGTKYSSAMKATYLDVNQKAQMIVMGCYGIGVSRVVAACIEQCHDASGIIWPESLAPWDLIICPLNVSNSAVTSAAERLYEEAKRAGLDVLLDDRDMQVGAKLKDADLIGIPRRIVVGERKIAENKVELKRRADKDSRDVALSMVIAEIHK